MATFDNRESLASVRTKINAAISFVDSFARDPASLDPFPTVLSLTADTTLTYTTGQAKSVATGDIINAGGFRYEVAASGATDHHVTTAGGVKLYVLPGVDGRPIDALGAGAGDAAHDAAAFAVAATVGGSWALTPGSTYLVQGVALNENGTRLICPSGTCIVQKSANGEIFTGSGNDLYFEGILFRGGATVSSGLTGDNLSLTGERPTFVRCGSRFAAGRALKATGNEVRILAPVGNWATDDNTSNGYDLEIGNASSATLYHQIENIVSNQNFGGILLVNTGSHVITGGQIGKLTLQGPATSGANGGMTTAVRILGAVSVGISGAIFVGNQFGSSATVDFLSGVSGCVFVGNTTSGGTITNSGNANNYIQNSALAGSTAAITWGATGATRTLTLDGSSANLGYQFDAALVIPSARGYRARLAGGSAVDLIGQDSSDNVFVGHGQASSAINLQSGTGGANVAVGGTTILNVYSGGVRPQTDNARDNGTSAQRWRDTFSRQFRPGDGTPIWTSGTGTPEGVVTAPVGSLFTRTDGGAATTLYVKETGSGNTGWVGK